MQRRASSLNGAVIAPVGQAARQRVHEPQWFFSGVSGARSRVVMIWARKIQFAQSSADEIGVFTGETKAGALGQVALEQWAGIHVPQRPRARAAELVQEFRE